MRGSDEGGPARAAPPPAGESGARLAIVPAAPPPSGDDVIEAVPAEIATLARKATWAYHLAVGRLLVERSYGGDAHAFHDRCAKVASLRSGRQAARP